MNKFIPIGVGALGAFLFILGAILHWAVIPKIIHSKVIDEMQLRNGTEAYNRFVKLPVPLSWSMTFFEPTNYKDFEGSNAKKLTNVRDLTFRTRGPYVYDEYREKHDVQFSPDGSNVTFIQHKRYIFNAEKSCKDCSKDDTIRVISPAFGILEGTLRLFATPANTDLWPCVKDLSVELKMEDLAFNGTKCIADASLFNEEKIEAVQVMDTGKNDISKLFQYIEYGNSVGGKQQDTWNPVGPCNDIRGSDAIQFPPFLDESSILYAFEPMICKSFKFVHDPAVLQSVSIRGIDTIRYYAVDENFARIAENLCHCMEPNIDNCPADLLNLKKCGVARDQMDMLVSSPYFQPFPENRNLSYGWTVITPPPDNYETYGTYVDVEPLTGVVLRAKKRLHLHIQMKKGSVKPILDDLTENKVFVPLAIIEEAGEVDEANAQMIKDKALTPRKVANIGMICMMVLGAVLLLAAGGLGYYASRNGGGSRAKSTYESRGGHKVYN